MNDFDVRGAAAELSLHAPSVLNTQPWQWRITATGLELHAATERMLPATDPDGRMLTLSCGVVLHHARVALAAAGRTVDVERMPPPADYQLMARLTLTGVQPADPFSSVLATAITHRRTDRRAFNARPVDEALLCRLRAAAQAQGVHAHLARRDQMPLLAIATGQAAVVEHDDRRLQRELHQWTHRPPSAGDGVPAATAVRTAPRRVPIRQHVPDTAAGLVAGEGFDLGASWIILYGPTDEPAAWLRAGEALSALLLTATAAGLATAPLSQAVEQPGPRALLRRLLPDGGHPFVVVRLGHVADPTPLPAAPRRNPATVIERDVRTQS
jgi:nitroreductase